MEWDGITRPTLIHLERLERARSSGGARVNRVSVYYRERIAFPTRATCRCDSPSVFKTRTKVDSSLPKSLAIWAIENPPSGSTTSHAA